MSSSRIKEFIRNAVLRMKIALAFHIIIKTPPGKIPVEYARELQAMFKPLHAVPNNDLPQAQTHALQQQQLALSNHFSSINPTLAVSSECTANSLDSGYNSCDIVDGENSQLSSLFAEYSTPLNYTDDVRITLSANLNFIRGLIRLQDLMGKDDEVLANSPDLRGTEIESVKPNYRIPSGVIQYALQSSNAEEVVKKSVEEILRHLCGIALKGTELACMILHWEGSLLQHSMMVIRKLSQEKIYQKAIVQSTGGLATILIADMLKNYTLEKNSKLEHQVTLLLQLCGSVETCSEVLNILIDKINMISRKCTTHQSESILKPSERTVKFESLFYIFHLAEKLLKRYFTLQQINSSPNVHQNKGSNVTKITELWRGAWDKHDRNTTSPNVPGQQLSASAMLAQSWCASLENSAKVFSFNYPLFTIYANNCLTLTVTNQKKDFSNIAME